MMDEQALLRYSRHILLKEIGIEGQLAICQATVLVVGCGGLGATVISILAAAGVKQLILADNDRLELSNLQRQVAYSEADIGQPKVVLAAQVVRRLNKQVATQAIQQKLDQQALIQLMDQADVVVDCTDNYITRHAVNQAALKTKTPLVSGAASRFDGQLTVFDFRQPHSPCYACLFDPTMLSDDGRCATLGIFSPLVGMIGSQQAAETLKLIGQIGKSPIGQLIVYDALFAKMHIISFAKRFDCTVCANPLSI